MTKNQAAVRKRARHGRLNHGRRSSARLRSGVHPLGGILDRRRKKSRCVTLLAGTAVAQFGMAGWSCYRLHTAGIFIQPQAAAGLRLIGLERYAATTASRDESLRYGSVPEDRYLASTSRQTNTGAVILDPAA
jgi:hypothetical protein